MTAVVTAYRSDGTPLPVTFGYVSFRHTTGAITRLALAYSNLRLLWWPLAYFELPLMWVLLAVAPARRPGDLVTAGGAAAMRPAANAERPPQRPAWRLVVCVVVGLAVVVLAPFLTVLTAGTRVQLTVGEVFLLVLWLPLVTFAITSVTQHITGRGLDRLKRQAQQVTNRTPVLATTLGAWPCSGGRRKGNGDGFALIKALADDARTRGEVLVGAARTRALADRYVDKTTACRYDPTRNDLRSGIPKVAPGSGSPTRTQLLYWPGSQPVTPS